MGRETVGCILHISDLHIGSENKELCDKLSRVVTQRYAPTHLVVSGDLVDQPWPASMRRAAEFIFKLREELRISPQNVLVVPGNHDYKFFGNFGLRYLTRIPFNVYFRSEEHHRATFGRRLRRYVRLFLDALNPKGGILGDTVVKSDNNHISLVGFDSTPIVEMFAAGRVSADILSKTAGEYASAQHDLKFKVAVVHHHPAPIPYLPTSLRYRIEESLMILYNAGAFLRELSQAGFELVLHGHRHLTGFSIVSYGSRDGDVRSIAIGAAGSSTKTITDEGLGNSFNVVNYYDDGTADLVNHFYTAEQDAKQCVQHEIVSIHDVAQRRYNRLRRSKGISVGRYTRTLRPKFEGYTDVEERFESCRVPGESKGFECFDFTLETRRPYYLRSIEPVGEDLKDLTIDRADPRSVKCALSFKHSYSASDGPLTFGYKYRVVNAHAMSSREIHQRYSHDGEAFEYASVELEEACDHLELRVEFPDEFEMKTLDSYEAVVEYKPPSSPGPQYKTHDIETKRLKRRVRLESSNLVLEVARPISGFKYKIRWNYRDSTITNMPHPRRTAIVRYVLSQLRQNVELAGIVAERLKKLVEDVESKYPVIDRGEVLNASLAVLDEGRGSLRFVAATYATRESMNRRELYSGEGCAGLAFKQQKTVFYSADDKVGYYVRAEELGDGAEHVSTPNCVLVAIPWIDGESVLGVFTVFSNSATSRLSGTMDNRDALLHSAFFDQLMRAVGGLIIGDIMRKK